MAGTCVLKNPHLSSMDKDFLYHIGYSREDCKDMFKDVKVDIVADFIGCGGGEPLIWHSWDRVGS